MRVPKVNFSKGEIAPHLYARFDVDAYHAGVKRGRNVCVLKYGGLTKRPGTRLVARAHDDSLATRGFSFQFSLEQGYILEMGNGYMRALAQGGVVLGEELAIVNISNAAEAEIEAALHGFSVGDQIYLSSIDEPMTALNGRFWIVQTVPDDDHFTIDADTSAMGAFVSASGGITRTVPPDPDPVPPVVATPVPDPDPPNLGGWDFTGGLPWA